METAFVITPNVINTINSLPKEERYAVTSALAVEMILGGDAKKGLTPVQEILYTMIKSYVARDTERARSAGISFTTSAGSIPFRSAI